MEKFKEILLGALLLIFLFVGLSASKERSYPTTWRDNGAEIVMHPAQPKSIFAANYSGGSQGGVRVVSAINSMTTKGYIVKKCEANDYGWVLVMEKY